VPSPIALTRQDLSQVPPRPQATGASTPREGGYGRASVKHWAIFSLACRAASVLHCHSVLQLACRQLADVGYTPQSTTPLRELKQVTQSGHLGIRLIICCAHGSCNRDAEHTELVAQAVVHHAEALIRLQLVSPVWRSVWRRTARIWACSASGISS